MGFPKFPIVPKKPALPAPKKPSVPAPQPKPKKTGPEVIDAEWEPAPKRPAPPPAPIKPAAPPPPEPSLAKKLFPWAAGAAGGAAALDAFNGNNGGDGDLFGPNGPIAKDSPIIHGDGRKLNERPVDGFGGGRKDGRTGGPVAPPGGFVRGGNGNFAVVGPPKEGMPLRDVKPAPAGPNIRPPANPKPPIVNPGDPGVRGNPAVPQQPPANQPGNGRMQRHMDQGAGQQGQGGGQWPLGQQPGAGQVDADRARPEGAGLKDLARRHRPEELDAVNAWRNEILGAVQRGDPVDKRGRNDLRSLMNMEHRMKQGNVTPEMQEEYSDTLNEMITRYAMPRIEQAKSRNEAYEAQARKRGQFSVNPPMLPRGTHEQIDAVQKHLGKGAEKKPDVVKRSRSGSPVRYAKTSYIMASSNIKEDPNKTHTPETPGAGHANTGVPITYADAISSHRNDTRTQVSTGKAADYIKRITRGAVNSSPGYGVWSDGAEDAVVHEVNGDVSHQDLRKAAANVGYTQGQKAVLAFTPHEDGQHFFSTFDVGNAEPNALIKELSAHGVDNKTLVPNKTGGFRVHVFDDPGMTDGKPAATQALHGWAASKGINVTTQPGTGSFVGSWGTRQDGKQKYWQEDPTLKPGSSRPYADRQIITQKGGGMRTRLRYSAEQAGADAKKLMGSEPSAGSLAVMTRYLQDLQGSDPDKFEKLMQQHDAPGRELHYKWLDSLGEGTKSLLKHLAGQDHKLAKSVLSDPTSYRRNLRDLHHELLDAGFYQPGTRPVWPDRERLMEVSGKLKQMGRLGELDQYIQSVQQGEPMIDLEESDAPAPPEDDGQCAKCAGK